MQSGNKAIFCQLLGDSWQDMAQCAVKLSPSDHVFHCTGKFWPVMDHLVDYLQRVRDLSDDTATFVGDGTSSITGGG